MWLSIYRAHYAGCYPTAVSNRYRSKGIQIFYGSGYAANELVIALRFDHPAYCQRDNHGFERIGEVRPISLPQTARFKTGNSVCSECLRISSQKKSFVHPPHFGLQCRGEEIRDIRDPLPKANQLPVEKAWLRLAPEYIPCMTIVMHQGLRRICKKTHGSAAMPGIADGPSSYGARHELSSQSQPSLHQWHSQGRAQMIFQPADRTGQPSIGFPERHLIRKKGMKTGELLDDEHCLRRSQGVARLSRGRASFRHIRQNQGCASSKLALCRQKSGHCKRYRMSRFSVETYLGMQQAR